MATKATITLPVVYAYFQNGYVDFRTMGTSPADVVVPTETLIARDFRDPQDVSIYSIVQTRPAAGVREDFFTTLTADEVQALVIA